MLAITGSTGAVGGRVARALADDFRNDLRLVVRDAGPGARLRHRRAGRASTPTTPPPSRP